jgi:hypothetical protein
LWNIGRLLPTLITSTLTIPFSLLIIFSWIIMMGSKPASPTSILTHHAKTWHVKWNLYNVTYTQNNAMDSRYSQTKDKVIIVAHLTSLEGSCFLAHPFSYLTTLIPDHSTQACLLLYCSVKGHPKPLLRNLTLLTPTQRILSLKISGKAKYLTPGPWGFNFITLFKGINIFYTLFYLFNSLVCFKYLGQYLAHKSHLWMFNYWINLWMRKFSFFWSFLASWRIPLLLWHWTSMYI